MKKNLLSKKEAVYAAVFITMISWFFIFILFWFYAQSASTFYDNGQKYFCSSVSWTTDGKVYTDYPIIMCNYREHVVKRTYCCANNCMGDE
jgi:hypothetical protein